MIPTGFRKWRMNSIKSISLLILVVMFADYESLIVLDYQKKIAANNAFPLSLIQPTPARLKAECLAVCNKRFERKDERTLRAFFGEGGDKGASLQAINRCD